MGRARSRHPYPAYPCLRVAQADPGRIRHNHHQDTARARISPDIPRGMSMKSIAKRIHRAIFVITLVCIVAMVLSVLLVNESLEDAMLQVEITEDQNFFLTHKKDDAPVIWESPNLIIAHLPQGAAAPADMPSIFSGLSIPFSDEIERSEERRVGKECVSTCRSRWSRYH